MDDATSTSVSDDWYDILWSRCIGNSWLKITTTMVIYSHNMQWKPEFISIQLYSYPFTNHKLYLTTYCGISVQGIHFYASTTICLHLARRRESKSSSQVYCYDVTWCTIQSNNRIKIVLQWKRWSNSVNTPWPVWYHISYQTLHRCDNANYVRNRKSSITSTFKDISSLMLCLPFRITWFHHWFA